MISQLFNIYIIIVCVIILYNLQRGFILTLISRIIIPSSVRFSLGSISISIYDVFILTLLVSIIIHHKKYIKKTPNLISKYLYIYILSTFVLIFLSSGYVPYNYQLFSFLKNFLFQTVLYILIGFWVLKNADIRNVIHLTAIVSLLAGIYGILTYILRVNIYIDSLNNVYNVKNDFSFFMEEIRGGLLGRVYGTMEHPLSWGQYWNLYLCVIYIFKSKINNWLWLALVCIGLINIILCGSRTAIVTQLVFVVFILLSYGIRKIFYILPLIYLFIMLIICSIPKNYKNSGVIDYIESGIFFWDTSKSERAGIVGSSTEMRLSQLRRTIDIMEKNPVGGVGYNYQYYSMDSGRVIDAELYGLESVVFKILIEQGLVGLVIFFYTLYVLYRFAIESIHNIRIKCLVKGFFCTFIVSILFTGIQSASYIFFVIFLFFINIKNDTENHSLLLVK